MTKSTEPTPKPEDILSDFTDRVLDGKISAPASSSDQKLRGLEETILRLNQAFPSQPMNENTARRMAFDFKIRRQKIEPSPRPVFWGSKQTFQRLGLAVAVIAIIIAVIAIGPSLVSGGNNIPASAGLHPLSIGLFVVIIGGILLLAIWLGRRK